MSSSMAALYPHRNVASDRATPAPCTPAQGYVVLDRRGDFVAWSPCLLAARVAEREHHAARIERCSDGAVMSYRARSPKRWRYEEAVPE